MCFPLFIIPLGLFAYSVWRNVRNIWANRHYARLLKQTLTTRFNYVDISDQQIYLAEPLAKMIEEFKEIGFRRIGEVEGNNFQGHLDRFWIMVDASGTTELRIVMRPNGPHFSLGTLFGDESGVQTLGDDQQGSILSPLHYPDFTRVTATNISISAAYASHQALVAKQDKNGVAPMRIETMDDYKRHSVIWGSRHYSKEIAAIMKVLNRALALECFELLCSLLFWTFIGLSWFNVIKSGGWQWYALLAALILLPMLPGLYSRMTRIRIR